MIKDRRGCRLHLVLRLFFIFCIRCWGGVIVWVCFGWVRDLWVGALLARVMLAWGLGFMGSCFFGFA